MAGIARQRPIDHTRWPQLNAVRPFIRRRELLLALVALLPGALTVYFAFNSGGYFPGALELVAVEIGLLITVRLVLARVPWEGFGVGLAIATVLLGFLTAWTLASSGWSDAPIRAMTEHDRALLYLLTMVFFGSIGFSVQRMRWMLYGLAAAIVAVCTAAFMARTLPNVINYELGLVPERLSYPLSYWNSLGILATIGIVLCGHLACSTREAWLVRVLGAASVPLLATVLFYTLSRGAVWVAPGALVVYVLVGRPRGLLSGLVAIVPPTVLALLAADPIEQLTDRPFSDSAISAGHRVALSVGLCILAAALLRALLLLVDRRVDRIELAGHVRRPLLAGGTVVGVLSAVAVCIALQVPGTVRDKYEDFTSSEAGISHGGAQRLNEVGSNGRQEQWDVAKAAFRAEPSRGTGAGTWALEWTKRRKESGASQEALSLYYEVLGELGLPGLIAVAAVLLLILGAFLARARGADRALFAALFAAGLAWAVHAGVDLDWDMPAVTLWIFALGGAALARTARADETVPRWTIALRVFGVLACAAVLILPAKVALSQARIDSSLDALGEGDCVTARSDARRALDVLSIRPTPFHIIGYCDLEQRRPRAAIHAMQSAIDQDPENWEFHLALAVSRARAGLDPRGEAQRALQLNPRENLALRAVAAFRPDGWLKAARADRPRTWRRVAQGLQLTAPGPPSL